jgi:phage terminase small subunit
MEYTKDPKAGQAQAAIRAGFSEKRAKETASELMKDPQIKEAIQRRLDKRFERLEAAGSDLSSDQVIAELDTIRDAAIDAGAGAWQSAARLKVAELKGKYLGMFKERVEIGLDEELIKRLEEGRKRAFLPEGKW